MPSLWELKSGRPLREKFGKVVFGSKDVATEQPLVRLSNLDLKWYTPQDSNNIHESYEDNSGKTVSLRCSFSVKDQHDKACTQEMTFLLPEKLGSMVEPNLELVKNGNVLMVEQAKRSGYSNEEIDRTIPKLEGGALPAFAGVGKNEKGYLMLHLLWQLVFVWDDHLDNDEREDYKQYEQLGKIMSCMAGALAGGVKDGAAEEGMSPTAAAVVSKHHLLFDLLREDALHAGKIHGCNPSPALDDVAEYLSSVLLELSVEWNEERKSDSQMFQRLQQANRELTAGVCPTLEIFALVEGISVEESIRQSFLFKKFKSLVTQHVTHVNDLFSYAKEFANGEVSNILYLHHVERGLSMEESLRLMESELNQISAALAELGELLLRLYKNDEGLGRFVKLGKATVIGHLQWYSYSQRYYPELVFDMIVH